MILLFLCFALLASAITVNKLILAFLPPMLFVGIRMLFAGILLFIFNYHRSHRLRFAYIKHDIIKIVILSAITTFIPSLLKAYALKYLLSSVAALLGSFDPFVTAFYAYFMFQERLTLQKLVGLILGFSGIVFLLISNCSLATIFGGINCASYPELAALGAAAISRFGWMNVQGMLKRNQYTPAEINGLLMICGGILALGGSWFLEPAHSIDLSQPTFLFWLLLYTVVIGNVVAYTLYAYLLKHYSATLVALTGFSVPLFVTLYGYVFLGEPVTMYYFVALAITFSGLLLFYQQELAKKHVLS